MQRVILVFAAALVLTAVMPTKGGASEKDDPKADAVQHAIVNFGQPQPQGTPPSATHFLQPEGGQPDGEVTIFKGGTVTFRVNGGGHGVSVYRVSKDTTRANIINAGAPDGLCQTRSGCDAAFIGATHQIRDGEGELVVDIGTNPPFGRVDDPERILVGTAALIPDGIVGGVQTQVSGIFHQGTSLTSTPPRPVGEQIRVKFSKNGRYLVICMNRGHSINDHMFSFVNVVGNDDDN